MRWEPAWWWGKRGGRGQPKSSELGAGRELLAELDLAGKVVTGDALYAQRDLSRDIVAAGCDYLWMLKGNQPATLEAVALLFREPPFGETFPEARQVGRHGGRKEQRWLRTATALNDYLDWPGLQQVCCLERTRTERGKTTVELAYAITSLSPERATPERLLELWRGHWGIENRLHWVRDVTLGEDRCRVRSGEAPQVLAALRNLVSGLLRLAVHSNMAAALRHYGWKAENAVQLLDFPCFDN